MESDDISCSVGGVSIGGWQKLVVCPAEVDRSWRKLGVHWRLAELRRFIHWKLQDWAYYWIIATRLIDDSDRIILRKLRNC